MNKSFFDLVRPNIFKYKPDLSNLPINYRSFVITLAIAVSHWSSESISNIICSVLSSLSLKNLSCNFKFFLIYFFSVGCIDRRYHWHPSRSRIIKSNNPLPLSPPITNALLISLCHFDKRRQWLATEHDKQTLFSSFCQSVGFLLPVYLHNLLRRLPAGIFPQ